MDKPSGKHHMTEERKPISQGLKLALEMGPLLVFFLANSYGDELAAAYPVLNDLGEKYSSARPFSWWPWQSR